MRTSTEIASLCQFMTQEEAVRAVARAGFDAFDLSMFDLVRYDWATGEAAASDAPLAGPDYVKAARRLRQIGLDHGVVCNQSHAPFPVRVPAIRDMLRRALECTAEAGGRICVIHPDNDSCAEKNAEMYAELLPFARACGVKMATENMWNWNMAEDHAAPAACSSHEDFLRHIQAVNDPYLVACVDIGHAEMRGLHTSAPLMLRTLGSHVQALHMHDVDLHHDNHELPMTLKVDWDGVLRALREIDYQGDFTLEASSYLGNHYSAENVMEGVQRMADAARTLANRFERLKKEETV